MFISVSLVFINRRVANGWLIKSYEYKQYKTKANTALGSRIPP